MERTYLHLVDGTKLEGDAIGFIGETSGEVVFTTAMVGYPQSLTDPSYNGQILVFTYPLIGNYGAPAPKFFYGDILENFESGKIWVRGVVVCQSCDTPSHFLSKTTFSKFLALQKIPGISGIDTRRLTLKLREFGTMRGKISSQSRVRFENITNHLVAQASIKSVRTYRSKNPRAKHVLLIDCGVKHGILRSLLSRGWRVTRIPWNADPLAVSGLDAVVCSNGPGDPKACTETIANVKRVIEAGVPFLGVCLGHQLAALALGADTYKLSYGHRGTNQPVSDRTTAKAYITSQNHGYGVSRQSLPKGLVEWFVNLNDDTNEGLIDQKKKIYSTQFHPEGSPGPFDSEWVFDLL